MDLIPWGKFKGLTVKDAVERDEMFCKRYYYDQYKKFMDAEGIKNCPVKLIRMGNCSDMVREFDRTNFTSIYSLFHENYDPVVRQVYKEHSIPEMVKKLRLGTDQHAFFDYLFRKYLKNIKNESLKDVRAESCKKAIEDEEFSRFIGEHGSRAIRKRLPFYEDFKKIHQKEEFPDILECIWQTAVLERIYFSRRSIEPREFKDIDFVENLVNKDCVKDFLSYLDEEFHGEYIFNPFMDCKYFYADADLIDTKNNILYVLRTTYREPDVDMFVQLILYGLGYYLQTKVSIRKFIIMKPIAGKEYCVTIEELNYDELEKVIASFVVLPKAINRPNPFQIIQIF